MGLRDKLLANVNRLLRFSNITEEEKYLDDLEKKMETRVAVFGNVSQRPYVVQQVKNSLNEAVWIKYHSKFPTAEMPYIIADPCDTQPNRGLHVVLRVSRFEGDVNLPCGCSWRLHGGSAVKRPTPPRVSHGYI